MSISGGVQELLDGLHIEGVEIKINTYQGDGKVVKHVSNPHSLLVLCGLFAAFAVLRALRSYGWSLNELPTWIALFAGGFLLAISAFFVWVAQSPDRASYFLGASVALGELPEIPKLYFLKDVAHLALFVFVVAHWRSANVVQQLRSMTDIRLRSYVLFLILAVVSVGLNFVLRGDVWQLKVGLLGLWTLAVLLVTLCVIFANPGPRIFRSLYRGFLESAPIAAALGLAAVVLLLITHYSAGATGDGRNTLWGLGYFDRLTFLFDGPSVAACYFVVAMSFAICELSKHRDATKKWLRVGFLFLVQISPWLIVASGSRVGKIALLVLIVSGLIWKPVRRATLIAFLSAVLAMWVSLDFQSLPSALGYRLGQVLPEYFDPQFFEKLRLGERFFVLEERGDLMRDSIQVMREAPFVNQLIGMGYGVAGYRTSPYSEPHNQFMGVVVEVGVLGVLALGYFALICVWRAFVLLRGLPQSQQSSVWAFSVSLVALLGLAVSYQITTKGIMLVLLLLTVSRPGMSKFKTRD